MLKSDKDWLVYLINKYKVPKLFGENKLLATRVTATFPKKSCCPGLTPQRFLLPQGRHNSSIEGYDFVKTMP